MGVRERRQREREQTRDTILASARSLMREVGPQAVSLREIARRAEYSPAALYEYFEDKDAIFQALFREGFERFGAALRAVPTDQPAEQRLQRLARAYVAFADANPEHYQVMFGQPLPGFCPTPDAAAEADATFDILYRCVADGVAQGVFRPLDQTATLVAACAVWSLVHGFVSLSHARRFGGERTPDELSAMLDQLMRHLLCGLTQAR